MSATEQPSALQPFRHRAFAMLWSATLVSNIGTWMHDVGAGWLMTSLAPSPVLVSLVQAATTLPVFLFALPAGALADIVDRRRILLIIQACMAVVTLILGFTVANGQITAPALIAFTFALGTGAAFLAPAWQSIVPQLVPKGDLPSAVALNSVGINISRAIGPALGGAIIVSLGVAWPFLLNGLSFAAVIAALLWWRAPPTAAGSLPAERFFHAMRAGIRYTRASAPLQATLLRSVAFFLFASAYWGLLPLIARQRLNADAQIYGLLVTCIGAGAVASALLLPRVREHIGVNGTAMAGTLGTVAAIVTFALARLPLVAAAAGVLAGMSWIAVLSSLNVSAQMSLPDWVRARGLAVYNAVFFGSMALGSVVWGKAAEVWGIPAALMIAASGALVGASLTRRYRLQAAGELDLSASLHWPPPLPTADLAENSGPVMVTVDYRIDPAKTSDFVTAIKLLEQERRRDGAFAWGVFRDSNAPDRFLEYFLTDSWQEHQRHHARVTRSDREIQARVQSFQVGESPPRVTHYVTAESRQGETAPPTVR